MGWIHRPEVQSLPGVMLGAQLHYVRHCISNDGFLRFPLLPFQEHEKRCWSVDFNLMDPKLLASGSDDAKGRRGMQYLKIMFPPCISPYIFLCMLFSSSSVKLWSTNLDNSVASIEAKANVCCVKFSPTSRYHLAFGCAGEMEIKDFHV